MGNRALITGCGTLAHGLAQWLDENIELAVYSRNEASQYAFQEKWKDAGAYLGDVQDLERLTYVIRDFKPNIIIHTAAAKRVDIAEKEPINTVKQNVVGTMNIGLAALRENIPYVIGIGTDKEVSPQTIYGWSKALGTKILLDYDRIGDAKFAVVRYGNILCSRSSVGVTWLNAANKGKGETLKVTNPDMTRFWFTVKDGVNLIKFALNRLISTSSGSGKIYSSQMCAGTLKDLASTISKHYRLKEPEIVGLRVESEKIHEALIGAGEVKDTIMLDDINSNYFGHKLRIFVTTPGSNKSNIEAPFTSDIAPKLSEDQLWSLLMDAKDNTYQG